MWTHAASLVVRLCKAEGQQAVDTSWEEDGRHRVTYKDHLQLPGDHGHRRWWVTGSPPAPRSGAPAERAGCREHSHLKGLWEESRGRSLLGTSLREEAVEVQSQVPQGTPQRSPGDMEATRPNTNTGRQNRMRKLVQGPPFSAVSQTSNAF